MIYSKTERFSEKRLRSPSVPRTEWQLRHQTVVSSGADSEQSIVTAIVSQFTQMIENFGCSSIFAIGAVH